MNNKWTSFHNDVTKIKETLKRNSFPPFLIDKITKSYLDKVHSCNGQSDPESNKTCFCKLRYTGKYSKQVQKKMSKICKQLCRDTDLKIVCTSFKIDKNAIFFEVFSSL